MAPDRLMFVPSLAALSAFIFDSPEYRALERDNMTDAAKAIVRKQYAASGDAYVRSATHAGGDDLARLVAVIAPQPSDRLLDVATGGGHVAKAFAPMVAEVVASD